MSDRELLELAAKSAGYSVRWHDNWKCFVHDGPHNIDNPPTPAGERHVWIPLNDDGDALRLAVQLGMRVYVYPGGGDNVTVVANDELKAKDAPHISEAHGEDKFAATRRAIVRAAAEMARTSG